MELNSIVTGLELLGTTVKDLNIENNIVDVEKDGKRSFGLYINGKRPIASTQFILCRSFLSDIIFSAFGWQLI